MNHNSNTLPCNETIICVGSEHNVQDILVKNVEHEAEMVYLFSKSGNTGYDSSKYKRNAVNNPPQITEDVDDIGNKRKTCIDSSLRLNLLNHVSLFETFNNFGVGCWYRYNQEADNSQLAVFSSQGKPSYLTIDVGEVFKGLQVNISDGEKIVRARVVDNSLYDQLWKHVYIQTGENGVHVYINGEEKEIVYVVGSQEDTLSLSQVALANTLTTCDIGGGRINVDSVYLFNSILSNEQVNALYKEQLFLKKECAGRIFYNASSKKLCLSYQGCDGKVRQVQFTPSE